jgi:hypothetical protein
MELKDLDCRVIGKLEERYVKCWLIKYCLPFDFDAEFSDSVP